MREAFVFAQAARLGAESWAVAAAGSAASATAAAMVARNLMRPIIPRVRASRARLIPAQNGTSREVPSMPAGASRPSQSKAQANTSAVRSGPSPTGALIASGVFM